MDFGGAPKSSQPRWRVEDSSRKYWGVTSFAANLAAIAVSFPFEASKVKTVFGETRILPQGSPLQWYRFGFSQHLLRMVFLERITYVGQEDFKTLYLQGLHYPGFWRRLLTELTPFYMCFIITGYLEVKKIDQLARQSREPQSWNKAAMTSYRFWKFNTISAIMSCVFVGVERGASELLRKKSYQSDAEVNYLTYDRLSLMQKMITIPAASIVSYPLEFIRVTYCRRITHVLGEESLSLLAEARFLLGEHSKAGLRGYSVPLVPYTISNLIYYCTFAKFNFFARSIY